MNANEIMQELVVQRKAQGLRQSDVAEAIGVGQPSVSEMERGIVTPKLETLHAYAKAVSCKLEVKVVKVERWV